MNDRAQLLAALDHLRSAFTNRAHQDRIILAADAAVVIERGLSIYAAGPESLSVPQDAKSNPSNGLVERLRAVASKANSTVIRRKDGRGTPAPRVFYECADLALEAADALALYQQEGVLSSQQGDDWVLVPREPTLAWAQRAAGERPTGQSDEERDEIEDMLLVGYRAMVSKRPTPPASQRGDWQPIETAPVDTRIFLWCADLSWNDERTAKVPRGLVCGRVRRYAELQDKAYGEGMNGDWTFTHWMPLPASPATPIGGLSLGVEGDQGASVAGLPAPVAETTATDAQHSAGKED